jgi:hypothetical protein
MNLDSQGYFDRKRGQASNFCRTASGAERGCEAQCYRREIRRGKPDDPVREAGGGRLE